MIGIKHIEFLTEYKALCDRYGLMLYANDIDDIVVTAPQQSDCPLSQFKDLPPGMTLAQMLERTIAVARSPLLQVVDKDGNVVEP